MSFLLPLQRGQRSVPVASQRPHGFSATTSPNQPHRRTSCMPGRLPSCAAAAGSGGHERGERVCVRERNRRYGCHAPQRRGMGRQGQRGALAL
jgi:hypothetical protein